MRRGTLFLKNGYAATTMEDIAALAGSRSGLYTITYPDKDALFKQIVQEVIAYAEEFRSRSTRGLHCWDYRRESA
jgi:AcrR family transcriptional regulator